MSTKSVTYRQLSKMILDLPKDHIDDDVTIFDPLLDEFFFILTTNIEETTDVLDKGHLYLVMRR